jgi:flagellar hook-associated protein 2
MSPQGLFSIGGIASGLDTENIVSQLLKLERQPMQKIVQRQDDLRKVDDAWGKVNTKLSSLRTAIDAIARPDRFDRMVTATSSNPDAVSVTTTGTTGTGTQSFTVQQLATRQQTHSADSFASRDAALDGRTLEVTIGGTAHDLTADLGPDATLDDLVTAVNDAGMGVRASALQVAPGDFRLVLDADETGTANGFEVTTTGWDAEFTTQEAQDAKLKVGGIEVTRSSNTIDDLVDGASITLRRTTDEAVSVTAERDVDGAVKAVKDYVDALNGVLTTIKDLTAYNAESKTAGPLQGQYAANTLAMSLRSAVSMPLKGVAGPEGLASSVGISLTRDGTVSFDEEVARRAFSTDFDAAAATLARSGSSSDPAVSYLTGSAKTVAGTYDVEVTQAAAVARVTGSAFTPLRLPQGQGGGQPGDPPQTFRITSPGHEPVLVEISNEVRTLADAVTKINEALSESGVTTIRATETANGELLLQESRYGSGRDFAFEQIDANGDVVYDGGVFGTLTTEAGLDVVGTIDGVAAVGTGRTLRASTGPAEGLSVRIDGVPAGVVQVAYSAGIMGQVGAELAKAEGIEGTVARARASIDSQIGIYQTRLEGFERRLETREATIRRQFVGMESMLQKLNSQGAWLSQQLQSLNSLRPQK